MNTNLPPGRRAPADMLAVTICGAFLGTGIGFAEGLLSSFRSAEPEFRNVFPVDAAAAGCFFAGVLSPIVFFALLRSRATLVQCCGIGAVAGAVGSGAALLLGFVAGGDSFVSPALTIALVFALSARIRRKQEGNADGPPAGGPPV